MGVKNRKGETPYGILTQTLGDSIIDDLKLLPPRKESDSIKIQIASGM